MFLVEFLYGRYPEYPTPNGATPNGRGTMSDMNSIKEDQDGWGGRRANSGRKPGSANKRTREIADKAAEDGLTPLDYMLSVLRDDDAPFEERKWAAEKAAPYMHPRLQSTRIREDEDDPLIVEIVSFYDRDKDTDTEPN